jgi:vacuolar-type H+-ATPase subunit I/STV1
VRGDLFGDLFVNGVLLLLVGWFGAVEIEELRPVKPDALRAARLDFIEFVGKLDVGR